MTRTAAEVERFFDGFDLLDPGVVEIQRWRPDGRRAMLPGGFYGGVGARPRGLWVIALCVPRVVLAGLAG